MSIAQPQVSYQSRAMLDGLNAFKPVMAATGWYVQLPNGRVVEQDGMPVLFTHKHQAWTKAIKLFNRRND